MYTKLEVLLGNFSFIILFSAMIFYWVQIAFYQLPNNNKNSLQINSAILFTNSSDLNASNCQTSLDQPNTVSLKVSANLMDVIVNKVYATITKMTKNLGTIAMFIANFCLVTLLVLRWIESGHFPLSNLYESLMFLSWSCTTIHLFITLTLLNTTLKNKKIDILTPNIIGCITAPCGLFTNAFATFSLPTEMQQAAPLVPALQSNWLMMHVTVMILSYAALILGSLLSIAYLILTSASSNNLVFPGENITTLDSQYSVNTGLLNQHNSSEAKTNHPIQELRGGISAATLHQVDNFSGANENNKQQGLSYAIASDTFSRESQPAGLKQVTEANHPNKALLLKLAYNLDNLSYRILGIGFPFLTIGILSGAVWANEAWGSYWSWDPKETWALLTWLVFAIYLHTRLTKGWEGKKPAMIASLGFIVVWICFLGVNLIGEGLHSYGWMK
nr:heme attachment to plastid cytochrome c [Chlorosarcina stigmatica]